MLLIKASNALAKAEEVLTFEYLWHNEKMYSEIDILIEDCDESESRVPEFVFLMKPVFFAGFSVEDLFDNLNENIMCEDVDVKDTLEHTCDLFKAFRKFNEFNIRTIIYWEEDTSKKIRISGTSVPSVAENNQ